MNFMPDGHRATMPDLPDELLEADASGADQRKYLIYSPLEIAAILGTLAKKGSTVTAYFGRGDFILTSIVAVMTEQNRVYLDYGADPGANQRALRAANISFVAAHERIKIQFVAEFLDYARMHERDVFSMALPATLLRLQRREYFRIATPLSRPLVCIIAPNGARAGMPTEVRIVDISCGGIAVIDSSDPAVIDSGMLLRGCRILLPGLGELTTDIVVRSTFELTSTSGAKRKRAGCEFIGMRERDRALIQRYINKIERERRNRAFAR